ncbi:hypothetical protein FRC03_002126 [Tulasnella sp. 419]|nr:hypothetical protein FRC03_002126 [Tulasnella sp. 419]
MSEKYKEVLKKLRDFRAFVIFALSEYFSPESSDFDEQSLYIINHVFMPPVRPNWDDSTELNQRALCRSVQRAAQEFGDALPPEERPKWKPIVKFLKHFVISHTFLSFSKGEIFMFMNTMEQGDVLAFYIHAQNAAVIIRKTADGVIFESFEASPEAEAVRNTQGRLICSFPDTAVQIPIEVFEDPVFQIELSRFLATMNAGPLPPPRHTLHPDLRDKKITPIAHPPYITQLLAHILRGIGTPVELSPVTKRIGDDVIDTVSRRDRKPWRRSATWLVLRVVLQTSLRWQFGDQLMYKAFMVYMHARILKMGLQQSEMSSSLIACMQRKTARRLYKLGSSAPSFLVQYVQNAVVEAEALLQGRWDLAKTAQATSLGSTWAPQLLNLDADTALSLESSWKYLNQSLQPATTPDPPQRSTPKHTRRFLGVDNFAQSFSKELLTAFEAADNLTALADFERAVLVDLEVWAKRNLLSAHALGVVASCLQHYLTAILKSSIEDPELLSLQILTIFKLWVELDKMAVAQCPLLAEFSPEVPPNLLQPLLLRKSEPIKALDYVEKHLQVRHSNATRGRSVFSGTTDHTSFAIQYFDGSKELQALKRRIEAAARRQRASKLRELQKLRARYYSLKKSAEMYKCKCGTWTVKHHIFYCQKCASENEASKMTIGIHEWPLPQDPLVAKIVVFELAAPLPFSIWRTAIYRLLSSLDGSNPPRGLVGRRELMPTHPDLGSYCAPHTQSDRIVLSFNREDSDSYYTSVNVAEATERFILLDHSLTWSLYDRKDQVLVRREHLINCSIMGRCTFQLPNGPYRPLQYAVTKTSHTSNEIIANQSGCPIGLTFHEYAAFTRVRSGPRLQWLNILSELRGGVLSFHQEAVYCLLRQAIWQVGPRGEDGGRDWHVETSQSDFGEVLLEELRNLLHRLKSNRHNVVAMQAITALVSRLLASATDEVIIQKCLKLMRDVRSVTYGWTNEIVSMLSDIEDETRMKECRIHLCRVVAACRGTYDVDPDKAPALLFSTSDIAVFLHCAIILQYYTPYRLSAEGDDFRNMIRRDNRLSHMTEPLLSRNIVRLGEGLDEAIRRIWESYRSSSKWEHLPSPNTRWVTTSTTPGDNLTSQTVQFNLLSGQLLIDGKPRDQLPRDILAHPTYTRIFGKRILGLIPSDMPGMDFKTTSRIGGIQDDRTSGYQVYFALRHSESPPSSRRQLVIRTEKDGEILELIPHEVLKDDLPAILVEDKTHWLNVSTSRGEIEIRDLKARWTSSLENWRIRLSPVDGSGVCTKGGGSSLLKLVDRRTATMSMISGQLQALENPANLMITYSESGRLSVSLPRIGLDFFLNDQAVPHLECVNIPDMVVDANQSSGTMIGLRSQLVLRKRDTRVPSMRQLIVPYLPDSDFKLVQRNHHIEVVLPTEGHTSIHYFKYAINSTLGRLEGDGSMLSRLYMIFLHAVTSHCLPDPLTGHTGMEEAVGELRSAGMLSFQKLGPDEQNLLRKIRGIALVRTSEEDPYHEISPLVRHNNFATITKSIQAYEETMKIFTSPGGQGGRLRSTKQDFTLEDGVAYHNAFSYRDKVTGPSPDPCIRQYDAVYDVRNSSLYAESTDEDVVFNTSRMIFDWETRYSVVTQVFEALEIYGLVSGAAEKVSLTFTSEWLSRTMAQFFLSACDACRKASQSDHRYQILFSFSAWAYASVDIRPFLPTIFAFATVPQLRAMQPPSWPSYDLSMGMEPLEGKLSDLVFACAIQSEKKTLSSRLKEMHRKTTFSDEERMSQAKELVDILRRQWPCMLPGVPNSREWAFNIRRLKKEAGSVFSACSKNRDLSQYIQDFQCILHGIPPLISTGPSTPYTWTRVNVHAQPPFKFLSLQQLFSERDAPDVPQPPGIAHESFRIFKDESTQNMDKLRRLLLEFRKNIVSFRESERLAAIRQQYADDLESSVLSLENEGRAVLDHQGLSGLQTLNIVQHHHARCMEHLRTTSKIITESLSPSTQVDTVLSSSMLWPCTTERSLLGVLAFNTEINLPEPWRKALNAFACAILAFQHACRLIRYLDELKMEELSGELGTTVIMEGYHYSSTQLLIQIDGDFLARPTQVNFIKEMISPSSERNSAFQLNMGEGKSSVIVPMAASALSDGSKLARVIVLKQLAPSMFHLLVQRLGGLANQRIFYMPFSRSLRPGPGQSKQIRDLLATCLRVRGILVMQPEHILSFKLLGLDHRFKDSSEDASDQKSSSSAPKASLPQGVADHLLETQRWLDDKSRDILDESDEILHVKYQLVYTIGKQQSIHGRPDRWTIVQQVLGLVAKHIRKVSLGFPGGVEVHNDHSGGYPHIRILQDEAANELVQLIARDVEEGALEQFSFELFPATQRAVARSYITNTDITAQDAQMIEEYCTKSGVWNALLILRGLLARGLLVFVLKERRWRVDYGLDPPRSMLAVPYRAKDVPSLRAEFSHPDVAILLTCLSYYRQGLTHKQLEECFGLLFKDNDPMHIYTGWVLLSQAVPDRLKHLDGINTHDTDQLMELHRIFRHNQAVIDFFLSHVVFPRHAKEFPQKISASGWDLAEEKHHVTTGFSGTNDGRYLLPTSIHQVDPLLQSSTNAKVLSYLLQPENDHYVCIKESSQSIFEKTIIYLMDQQEPRIRVLLDVGAQMLRLSNEEVATEWLNMSSCDEALAVIYFGPDDEPYVHSRSGVVEALISSPMRQQLDKCLLYLDDAHTRGTDFKLPSGTRAAVTLGPKVTKDRLVQGCMRMRKLGYGQSVMFFSPSDIDAKIRESAGLCDNDNVQVKDILLWAMQQSCREVAHWISRWAEQGIDHKRRREAWIEFKESPDTCGDDLLKLAWIQTENWALDEMYASAHAKPIAGFHRLQHYPDILERYQRWVSSSNSDTRAEEEDEREVVMEREVEANPQWQPPKATPLIPYIHSDVYELVQNGTFRDSSPAFTPLLKSLGQLSFEKHSWTSPHLVATKTFTTPIEITPQINSHKYLRPVQWILSASQPEGMVFVVLSPDEVNELLPHIRQSGRVHLHLYTARIMQAMKSFDSLAFHCIPPLTDSWVPPSPAITTCLNIWAGQLYIEDYNSYRFLCHFLGLYTWQPKKDDIIQPDGFVKPEHRGNTPLVSCSFTSSQVQYLKKLLELRGKGMEYFSTHMGKILRGRLLTEEDFH